MFLSGILLGFMLGFILACFAHKNIVRDWVESGTASFEGKIYKIKIFEIQEETNNESN